MCGLFTKVRQLHYIPLVVVKGDPSGKKLAIRIIYKIHYMQSPQLHDLPSQYDELFQELLGTFKDYEAMIEMDPGASPCAQSPM